MSHNLQILVTGQNKGRKVGRKEGTDNGRRKEGMEKTKEGMEDRKT